MKELRPLVDEYSRLEAASKALQGVGGNGVAVRKSPGRPRGARKAATTTPRKPSSSRKRAAAARAASSKTTSTRSAGARKGRRSAGRPKGSGKRSAEALKYVSGQPGITIPELAAKMGIAQNYLYRVLPGLQQEKKVRKDGRGWHPVA